MKIEILFYLFFFSKQILLELDEKTKIRNTQK